MTYNSIQYGKETHYQPGPKPGTETDPDPTTPEIDPPIPPDSPLPNII